MSSGRFSRYLGLAKGDDQYAIRLYAWNIQLSQAFNLPIHIGEVSLRNTIAKPIYRRFGDRWPWETGFHGILVEHHRIKLEQIIEREQKARRSTPTTDQVLAALPLNFWCSMLTARYSSHLWAVGTSRSFPYVPARTTLDTIMKRAEGFRLFRNKIAHHYCIIDKSPTREHDRLLGLIGWICADTEWYCRELSDVPQVIGTKPQP